MFSISWDSHTHVQQCRDQALAPTKYNTYFCCLIGIYASFMPHTYVHQVGIDGRSSHVVPSSFHWNRQALETRTLWPLILVGCSYEFAIHILQCMPQLSGMVVINNNKAKTKSLNFIHLSISLLFSFKHRYNFRAINN